MNKIINEFFQTLNERVKSTFYWGFIFSWLISNYKILLVIFFYNDCGCNEGQIKCIVANADICHCLIYPFIGAIIYAIIIPWIDVGVFWVRDKAQQWFLKIKYGDDKLIPVQRVKILEEQISELDGEHKKYLEFRDKCDNLKSENDILKEQIKSNNVEPLSLQDIFGNNGWRIEEKIMENVGQKYIYNNKTIKLSDINHISEVKNQSVNYPLFEILLCKIDSDYMVYLSCVDIERKVALYLTFGKNNENYYTGYYKYFLDKNSTVEIVLYRVGSKEDLDNKEKLNM